MESYSAAMPEDLDALSPEEHHHIYNHIYKMLSLHVKLNINGIQAIEGVVAFPKMEITF
jgi:hypothetical protein